MPRPGKYLFKRSGSQNWWLRLQYSGVLKERLGAKIEISMGTPDYAQAEINASDHIRDHKILLFAAKHADKLFPDNVERYLKYKPNTITTLEDGRLVHATGTQIETFDQNGISTGLSENTVMVRTPGYTLPKKDFGEAAKYFPKADHPDGSIIEDWITHQHLNKHLAQEAREVWRLLQTIIKTKPLSSCTRDQAKELVRLLRDKGNKSSTIEKKIGHLRAAVNLSIQQGGKMKANPFVHIMPKMDDKLIRLPMSNEDMTLVRKNLHNLSVHDQLVWKLLAATGMRLDEPFAVTEEFAENGVRFIMVGTKTETSKRRVPLPTSLLSELPGRINGPFLKGPSETVGKRLRYFLKGLEISYDTVKQTGDKRKVLHSLRHRAKDRLRAVRCPLDVQYEILGHEERTVASGYGRGSPDHDLLHWIDKIGF